MKPTSKKKLSLSRTTVRTLTGDALQSVGGAASFYNCITQSCQCGPRQTDYPPCVPNTGRCMPQSDGCPSGLCPSFDIICQ